MPCYESFSVPPALTDQSATSETPSAAQHTEASAERCIVVEGASTHNLKKLNCQLPHQALTVITGPSGSGKSSLAFHTLYAEAQRQFLESLSAYARQFFERIDRPPVDKLEGLLPAVALEQKNPVRHARATVGTTADVYDSLRFLLAYGGQQTCIACGSDQVKEVQPEAILATLTNDLEPGTRLLVVSPLDVSLTSPASLVQQGFFRLLHPNGVEVINLESATTFENEALLDESVLVLLDRLALKPDDKDNQSRLLEAMTQAARRSGGQVSIYPYRRNAETPGAFEVRHFRLGTSCLACGTPQEKATPHWFSFNHPLYACDTCEGYGRVIGLDPDRIIPNKQLSLKAGAVHPFQLPSNAELQFELEAAAEAAGIDGDLPYAELSAKERELVWQGSGSYPGIRGFFDWLESKRYKVHVRVMLARYRGYSVCPDCEGTRVKAAASRMNLAGASLKDLINLPLVELKHWLETTAFSEQQQVVVQPVLTELLPKLTSLLEVGLGYLTLGRNMRTLSGGEAQRVLLAKALGSGLTETLYVLDEPTVGLHPRDTQRLVARLKRLAALGNTLIVVEHDPDVMEHADYLLDIGPKSGPEGGEVVYAGTWQGLLSCQASSTAQALTRKQTAQPGEETEQETLLALPDFDQPVKITGATGNNLKNLTVQFPTQAWTCITGVSGAGKSTLLHHTLYANHLLSQGELPSLEPAPCERVEGLEQFEEIVLVDQSLPGRSTRSNPVTYVKAYDEIRKLFAEAPKAKALGLSAGDFSFNTRGGRCERCEGLGTITIDMQFMADVTLPCPDCDGKRFGPAVLSVEWFDHTLTDVLNMSVDQAIRFFKTAPKIRKRLEPLSQLGLGYLALGQATDTLSGGEAQRLKLASYLLNPLQRKNRKPNLFLFDEPTKGLHLGDVEQLSRVFRQLVNAGHTLLVIEHNMDFVANADWVVDLGPDGGEQGGQLVAEGTPKAVAKARQGYTAEFLAKALG